MGEMEKRLLLFFGVTFVLVSLWPRIFPVPVRPEPPAPVEGVGDVERSGNAPARDASAPSAGTEDAVAEATAATAVDKVDELERAEARAAETERTLVVETSKYEMKLTNRGARLLSFMLQEYRDTEGRPYEMVAQNASEQLNIRPLDVRLEDSRQTAAVMKALFEVDAPARILLVDGDERLVELNWSDGSGLEVTKRLTLTGGTYRIGVEVSVKMRGQEIAKSVLFGAGVGNEVAQSRFAGAENGVVATGSEVELFSAGEVKDGDGDVGNITATGVASHYFTALMLPERSEAGSLDSRLEVATIQQQNERDVNAEDETKLVDRDVITAHLLARASPVAFTLYIGPKELERVQALGPGMDQIIELGSWMRYPALVLRSWLLAIYDYVGNYGVAIVVLTVFINILLLPLKHYSFVSMRKMQKIAPQTQKIRERYKKVKPTDPRYREMNEEMQALYKEHGVNPVSGCLPMVLMIPFFFAFYRMLMASIELRQAPFILWIDDLAVYDPLFVLPILMGGTQLAIQKMTPQTNADPVQAKIMAFMPIMFTVMLAWAPAGLVLYWFANNLVSMTQQKITNRIMKDPDPNRPDRPNRPNRPNRKDAIAGQSEKNKVKTGQKRKGKKGGKGPAALPTGGHKT